MSNDFQARVAAFIQANHLSASPESRLLDVTSELGEVAKEWLKATHYGRTAFTPPETWAEELGDTFFALVALADATGVDLDTALDAVLAKYAARLAARGDSGSEK